MFWKENVDFIVTVVAYFPEEGRFHGGGKQFKDVVGDMKQPADQACQKVCLGSSMYQSIALPQDSINILPELCIAEILRHLENPEDRQSCASVCWRWADILVSQRPDFWGPAHRCLHLSDVDDAKLVAAVVGIHTRDLVTDLDLCHGPREAVSAGAPQLTDRAIGFVTSACRNLKSVCLANCSLTNKAAWIIASNCPELEDLVMLQSSISDDGLSQIVKQCRNLKSLHIEGSVSITEASLRALMQDAKRLESLTLGSCPQIGEDDILFFLTNQPYLGKLELKGMMAGESHWSGARQSSVLYMHFCLLHRLSSLSLVKCQGLHDSSILHFARNHFWLLRHLVIDDCRGLTDRDLMWLVGGSMNPMKLKSIKLARFHFSTSAAVITKVMSLFWETIESIVLDSCDFGVMTPLPLVEAVVRECPELKVIRLENCGRIMNVFLSWINIVCDELTEIRLIGSPAPFEHSIATSLSRILCHNRITKIELRSCHVTDVHINTIFGIFLRHLQEVILDDCPDISDGSAVHLRQCRNLIKLSLNHVDINDDYIRTLMAQGFFHLEELSLMRCPLITDDVLVFLAATPYLPELRRVNLVGCPNITQEAVNNCRYDRHWEIQN